MKHTIHSDQIRLDIFSELVNLHFQIGAYAANFYFLKEEKIGMIDDQGTGPPMRPGW